LVQREDERAEAGATPHEIMSITGHQTLAKFERYRAAPRKKKLVDAAMKKLSANARNREWPT